MKEDMKVKFAERVQDFRLPRYHQLPNMGLYLEQITTYVNGILSSIDCPEITSSMISNYVKKKVIAPPVKKQYTAEQIAYLIFISFAKNVLSLENIEKMIAMQKESYEGEVAYDYFCMEMENMLRYICDLPDTKREIGTTKSEEKTILRNVIIAASHVIFLNFCFRERK